MKIHIVTVGKPKLPFAKIGWDEYLNRLKHHHDVRVTHIDDRQNTSKNILATIGKAYSLALVIDGQQLTSEELASFMEKRAQYGEELCFIIGGPDGLQPEVIGATDFQLGLSRLTFPHDMAMVVLLEALYRASTISAGHPYHK